MRDFTVLFRYELKKILKCRMVWMAFALCLVGIGVSATSSLFGTYYVEGKPVETHYEGFLIDKANSEALSGRAIDQALLQETVDAYKKVPADVAQYSNTPEYEQYARPYSEIFNKIRAWTGMQLEEIQGWTVDEDAFYKARANHLEDTWTTYALTDIEKDYWRAREAQIEQPLVYSYHEGYIQIMKGIIVVGVCVLLFIAISLSGVFASEHQQRTDQLVLTCAKGKKSVYWAKILAGEVVAIGATLLMAAFHMALCLGVYGSDGFDAPLQLFYAESSMPITMGQTCLIILMMTLVTAILAAAFVMMLSELFRSSTAALAVCAGLVIMGQIQLGAGDIRILSQVWNWMPMTYLKLWNIFDCRLLPIAGHCLTAWQILPVIYLAVAGLFVLIGKRQYKHYQVSGR